jgi:hypothetical protein
MIHRLPRILIVLVALLVGACASYGGRGLQPGVATIDDVQRTLGAPVLRWRDADGSQQFAYPRGPAGTHTYMAFFTPDGRLSLLENVLQTSHFARIRPGEDDQQAILRRLGPPVPRWTQYFPARDELVWEWRFCDDGSKLARFDVLFDGTTGLVRSTYQRPDMRGPDGIVPFCGH